MNKQIKKQMKELEALKLPELQVRFAEIVGEETKAPNKKYLLRRIGEAIEAKAATAAEDARDDSLAAPSDVPASEMPDNPVNGDEPGDGELAGGGDEASVDDSDSYAPAPETSPTLDIAALQQRYLEVVGRPTQSDNAAYLKWKIRQAERGKVPVGPLQSRREPGIARDFKVLPVRMESDLVDKLDEAWKRRGLKSRMELFRISLRNYLASIGEIEIAEMLAVD
jgi:hypothetical protein